MEEIGIISDYVMQNCWFKVRQQVKLAKLLRHSQAAEVYEQLPFEKLLEAAELYKRGKEHVKTGEFATM